MLTSVLHCSYFYDIIIISDARLIDEIEIVKEKYNNLYNYGLYISTIVSEIKGIDKKIVNERYNSLYIHNKTEIKIEAKEICELLNKKPGKFLKEIFNDLKKKKVAKLKIWV